MTRIRTANHAALMLVAIAAGSSIIPTATAFSLSPISPSRAGALHAVIAEVPTSNDGDGDDAAASAKQRRFMYMTAEQDQLLVEKGDHEAGLMTKVKPLAPNKIKVRMSSGGFGGGGGAASSKSKKKTSSSSSRQTKTKDSADGSESSSDAAKERLLAEAKEHAKALEKEGLVRIDNILADDLADQLKRYLVELRARATTHVEDGTVQDSQERFADVLLNQNRCDLKVPFGPSEVDNAMEHILNQSVIRPLVEYVFDKYGGGGPQSTLYELNCFMSNKGARRQLVHSDNACVEDQVGLHPKEPIMLTCFVALQDTDATMGPTTWIPRTHNVESHRLFYEVDKDPTAATDDDSAVSTKDKLLQSKKAVLGTLPKGACVIFDPRVLHCAGANNCKDPDATRAMFYFSFKNPRVDNPGCPSCSGYGLVNADIPMEALCEELQARVTGQGISPRLDMISASP